MIRLARENPPVGPSPNRDFSAPAPNITWVGDLTEILTGIPTDEGKLYLSTALDLFSRRLLGHETGCHLDAELASETFKMAVAVRGGDAARVIFHTDLGSTYTAHSFTVLCDGHGMRQSMGRTGLCLDNAAAESFFSAPKHEVLSRHHFKTRVEAQQIIANWVVDFYNRRRRHSSCGMQSPIHYRDDAAGLAA